MNAKQLDALRHILFTDNASGIHANTLKALRTKNLINSVNQITLEGIKVIAPDAPAPIITPEAKETREIQDALIEIIISHGWDMGMRLSRDLPEEITGARMCSVIFPEFLSDLKWLLIAWSNMK